VEERGPFAVGSFEVEIDGRTIGFAEVHGLGVQLEHTAERVECRVNAVTLRRALVGDRSIWSWVQRSRAEKPDLRTVRITLLDSQQSPVCGWELRGARPVAWTGPSLDASAGEVAMEELVIVAEDIDYLPADDPAGS
jgi:phage tail-like protein